ncbi:50S ribosomal protein L19 [Candidatus Nomurabacteria bacterium]|nr:50S ribosomal protein L19 [Candidatus Nomurabacteria bacterium]
MSEDIRNALKSGMIVRVHQIIKDVNKKGEERQRIQMFEGQVLAVKHGNEAGATVTVRKVSNGVGVEKIFPIHSPLIEKIELVREMKVKQGRAYYLRSHKKKLKEVKKPTAKA